MSKGCIKFPSKRSPLCCSLVSIQVLHIITATPLVLVRASVPNRPESDIAVFRCLHFHGKRIACSLFQWFRKFTVSLIVPRIGTSSCRCIANILVITTRNLWSRSICDQTIQILQWLLSMPSQGMAINRKTCICGILNIFTYFIKIHATIISNTRSHLHGVAGYSLVKVAVGQSIHQFLLVIFIYSSSDSEVEVWTVLDVFLQGIILLQITILRFLIRTYGLEILVEVVCTRGQKHGPECRY